MIVKNGLFCLLPILSLLILIKNSGIFFVIIDIIVWFGYFIHNNGLKKAVKQRYILLLLAPFILLFLWYCHIKIAFDDASVSKHAMTVTNYVSNIKYKEKSDIEFIFTKLVDNLKNPKDIDNIIFWISLSSFMLMLVIYWNNVNQRKFIIKFFILFIITFILYEIGLFGMYLFSMPINEVKVLAGYIRYYRTIIMFEYGICVIVLMNLMNEVKIKARIKNVIINIVFFTIVISPVILYKDNLKFLYEKHEFPEASLRNEIINIKNNNNIEEKKSYLIYVSGEENVEIEYLTYILQYEFRSINIRLIRELTQLQDINEISNYDYFIILRGNDEIVRFVNKITGDVNQNVIRFR